MKFINCYKINKKQNKMINLRKDIEQTIRRSSTQENELLTINKEQLESLITEFEGLVSVYQN